MKKIEIAIKILRSRKNLNEELNIAFVQTLLVTNLHSTNCLQPLHANIKQLCKFRNAPKTQNNHGYIKPD